MSSKADSDVTYCSEVEQMLACNTQRNKLGNNLQLRRSLRLSQKCAKTSEMKKNIDQILVAEWNGVPLDLSYKSKESTVETSQQEPDEAVGTKYILDHIEMYDKDKVMLQNQIFGANSQRPKVSTRNISRNKTFKKATPKPLQDVNDNSSSNQSRRQCKYLSAKDVTESVNKPYNKGNMNISDCPKNFNNLKYTFPEDNTKGLSILSKLDLSQYDKHEHQTLFSIEYSQNNVAHSKKPETEQINDNVFVRPFYNKDASIQTREPYEEVKIPETLKTISTGMNEKHSHNEKPSKRGRKRKHESSEIVSNSNTFSNNKQNAEENNGNTPNFVAEFNKKNSFQTKIKQVKNEKSRKRQITKNEIQSNRVLRSQNAAVNKTLCGQITINTNLENQRNKIKMEQLSQKSHEEGIPTNKCIRRIPPAIAHNICCQCVENKFSPIEVKYESQGAKFETKLYKETAKAEKPLVSVKEVELRTENYQKETQSKITSANKNYIKLFDKNQFLDKIQKARSYVDHLAGEKNCLKSIKTFEIPPTPAESSEELLKKSILFKTYPAHFKYQLPPEAILTRSLDPQPLPTPDDTISSELLDSSSSSPSLPESLCELFKTKDIKDILNLKQTSYHLNSYHIQALALILNLQVEYLVKILDKVITTSPDVLKNIEKAVKTPFEPDSDLFSNATNEMWDSSSNAVPNSQSPKQRKISSRMK